MKKFSDRLRADWYTEEVLEDLLNRFFEDEEEPRTMTHLYCWLRVDWVEYERRKTISERFKDLLNAAELMCEAWVVSHGFDNDKSFAKFELDRSHRKTNVNTSNKEDQGSLVVNIVLDDKKVSSD